MNAMTDDKLVGMVTAERLLAKLYPRFALSRHQLRRLCVGRVPSVALQEKLLALPKLMPVMCRVEY